MGWMLGESERGRKERCFCVLRFGEKSSLAQTIEVSETEMPETGDVEPFEILRIGSWIIGASLQW